MNDAHPVSFSVDYPDRDAQSPHDGVSHLRGDPDPDRARDIGGYQRSGATPAASMGAVAVGGTGLLFLPPLLMIVFRQKYPRWWFDWNLELLRF